MTLQQRQKEKINKIKYQFTEWDKYDYSILSQIAYKYTAGRGKKREYNDCFIMLDTESSKKCNDGSVMDNHIVAFSVSIRSCEHNICTLYGHRPDECLKCLEKICEHLPGDITYIYIHNLSWDWTFLYRFMIDAWGTPERQLNVKPLYPILIEFLCPHIIFKDSLILAQRKLEKWADDLNVEHKKAVGSWDYEKIRNQSDPFTSEELHYIENDTLAGVECLDAMRIQLNKRVYSMPYTATGIPREDVQKIGKKHEAHAKFTRIACDYRQLQKCENLYHGGYVHANRYYLNEIVREDEELGKPICYDIASSYPFDMLAYKGFPVDKYKPFRDCSIDDIMNLSEHYTFIMKLILVEPCLKDNCDMPPLQYSKCLESIDAVVDNGRVLAAGYVELYVNELTLSLIAEYYTYTKHLCCEVEYASKGYLPRWFRDYVFQCFTEKTMLKGGDPVAYALAKSKVNSLYGLMVQHPVRPEIIQDYRTGEYREDKDVALDKEYDKFLNRFTSILPYQWGCIITSHAMVRLFELGRCCSDWIYSDTDSVYGRGWDMEKLNTYNNMRKEELKTAGYGSVNHEGKNYWCGIAELDSVNSEFITFGCKRYAKRDAETGELKITVAGVPKKTGAKCLKNNINNFKDGFIFKGDITGKKTHHYLHVDKIYTDENGNLTGDSIDLSPCDYDLSAEYNFDWEKVVYEEITINDYTLL